MSLGSKVATPWRSFTPIDTYLQKKLFYYWFKLKFYILTTFCESFTVIGWIFLEILYLEPINPQYSGVLVTCLALRYWFFEVLGSESAMRLFCPPTPPPPPHEVKKWNLLITILLISLLEQWKKVYKSGINLTFTVAMVAKMAAKIGWKKEIYHFRVNFRQLKEKLT